MVKDRSFNNIESVDDLYLKECLQICRFWGTCEDIHFKGINSHSTQRIIKRNTQKMRNKVEIKLISSRPNTEASKQAQQIPMKHMYLSNYSIVYYTILYYTILYYTILYYTILHYTILYFAILYYTILYYTILYYTILYCNILNYTLLY